MKGKKLFSLIFTLPIMSFALLYGGGYIAQFIENYKIWTSAGGTPGNGSSPEMPTFSIFDCFKSVFSFPYGIAGVGICVLAIGLLIFMIMRMGFGDAGELDKDRNFVYSNKGTYAKWGGSEGIYLHVDFIVENTIYNNYETVNFAVGKSLQETTEAFDKMQFIAGRIYRAFMGDGTVRERHIKITDK